MARRVVVTGIGLICGVGNTTEEVWKKLLAGKSGVARITQFDASQFACQIAAEVKNFDPLQFVEKKELKKMGRFIHLALAAADEAMKASGLEVTPEISERVGVHIGSGIGGFDVIEREHISLLNGGPRKISPFFIPAAIVNLAAGHVSIRYHARGPNEATCTACTSSAARHRRRFQDHRALRRRCNDRRRHRSGNHAYGSRRIRRHARAFHAE